MYWYANKRGFMANEISIEEKKYTYRTFAIMMILTVINALIFGFLTIEMYMLCKSIIPGMFIHFLFDFETKFILMNGNNLLIAEIIRGTVMTLIAIYFAIVLFRKTNKEMAVAESK